MWCIIRLLISIAIVIGMIICAILLMGLCALFIEYIPYIIAIGVTIFAIWYVYTLIGE